MRTSFLVITFLTFSYSCLIAQPKSEVYDIMINWEADYGSLKRLHTASFAPERRARLTKLHESYLDVLEELDFNSLSIDGQVDYVLFSRKLEHYLKDMQENEANYQNVKDWVDIGNPIYELGKRRRRGVRLEGKQVAKMLDEVADQVNNKRDSLSASTKYWTEEEAYLAEWMIKGQRRELTSVYEFYEDYDPLFTWWVEAPYLHLDSLLDNYARVLSDRVDPSLKPADDGSGIIGNPIGQKGLEDLLAREMIPYSPEELVEIAEKEFAWCDRELLKASREMGFGDDWQAAQDAVKQRHVAPGDQPEAMLELYHQSVEFLKENDLITIPPLAEETWRMTMLSPKAQRVSPFFLGGEVLQIAFPTQDMSHDEKMMSFRGNNPHFARAVVHHELIPGHHLQQFMNKRNKVYRDFYTPFWVEGWALYWERLLWDLDFPRGPEDKIGMLFWRMHRCARIIFSINYHKGDWTPQQCIDFLVERVGHERANAEGEVRRSFTSSYGPLYQIAYMIGGLQFEALKEEMVDSGVMSYKEFHDAVMAENAMPVEMLRFLIMREEVPEGYESSWRFYK